MVKKILIAVIVLSISVVQGQKNIRIDNNQLKWNLAFEKAKEISKKEKNQSLSGLQVQIGVVHVF